MKQRIEVALGCALWMVAALLWLTPLPIEVVLVLAGVAGLAGAAICTWHQTELAPLSPPPGRSAHMRVEDGHVRWHDPGATPMTVSGVVAPGQWARIRDLEYERPWDGGFTLRG